MNKQELRRNSIRFAVTILINTLIFAAAVFIFIYFGKMLESVNSNYVWALGFTLLLILLFTTFEFRNRIWAIVNQRYLFKIRENLGEPLHIKRLKSKEYLHRYMLNNDYELYSQDQDHRTYFKTEKNKVRRMFGGYILKVVVYIEKSQPEFYLSVVDDDVSRIQADLQKQRKKVQNFLVTQLKEIDELDDKTKKLITETLLFKTQSSVISTINVGLHHPSNKAVLFYSDKFSPSLYYTEHIEDIKKMV